MSTAPSALPRLVLDTIRRHRMLTGGERLLVAVSGGPDSVALLDSLALTAPELGVALEVAHVHHGLRPEADRDADFVRDLCARAGLGCHVERVAVRRGPPWDGPEAEARRARYRALAARARAIGAQRIATGHTADDQAETVVMRLLQGAGPRGLAGIAPRRGPFIRPLIEARRRDVVAHLTARGLAFVDDLTNRDLRFLRNRIRHETLPALAALAGGDLVERLVRTAAACRRVMEDLDRRAEAELDRLGTAVVAGMVMEAGDLAALPPELRVSVLLAAARRLGETRAPQRQVYRALGRLPETPASRGATRLGRLRVEQSGRFIRVGPARIEPIATRRLTVPGDVVLHEAGLKIEARCRERPDGYAPPSGPRRVAFDAAEIPDAVLVRARRRGDRFRPFGGGERRLKRVLIDAGVPRWDRSRVPLLESGGEILWIAGVRRGSAAPITAATRRILEVTVTSL